MIYILICILIFLKSINSIDIIKGSKILLSSNMNFSIPKNNKCKEIIIPTNFKKLKLVFLSNEINELLVTDKRINSCQSNQSIFDCCNNNSTFCEKDINPLKNYYHLYNCLNASFVYACGNNKDASSFLIIKSYVVKEEGCIINDFNDEIECANFGLSQCKNQPYSENMKCKYVECYSEKNERLLSLCLPINFTDPEINDRCSNHINYNEGGYYIKQIYN